MDWRIILLFTLSTGLGQAASISQVLGSLRTGNGDCNDILVVEQDNPGNWHGLLALSPQSDITEWTLEITFDNDVTSLLSPAASVTGSGKKWTLTNRDWDGDIGAGEVLELRFVVEYAGYKPLPTEVHFNDDVICTTSDPGPGPSPGGCDGVFFVESEEAGQFNGLIVLGPMEADVSGWSVAVKFTEPVDSIESVLASASGSGKTWTLVNIAWDGELGVGQKLDLKFIAHYSGNKPGIDSISFNDATLCEQGGDSCTDSGSCAEVLVIENEGAGNWQGVIALSPEEDIIGGWVVTIELNHPGTVQTIMGNVAGSGTLWTISNKDWDGDIAAGDTLDLRFIVLYEGTKPVVVSIMLNEMTLCTGGGGECGGNEDDCSDNYSIDSTGAGFWQGSIELAPDKDIHGWTVEVVFDSPVDQIDSAVATPSGSGTKWSLASKGWDDDIAAGSSLALAIIVHYSGDKPGIASLSVNGDSMCSGGGPSPTDGPDGPDCSDVISVDAQDSTSWTGSLVLEPQEAITSWTVDLSFDNPVSSLASAVADVSGSGTTWKLTNKAWDGDLNPGDSLNVAFLINFSGAFPTVVSVNFNGVSLCSGGDPGPTAGPTAGPTTTNPPITDCPYGIIVVYEDGSLASCPAFSITNEWGEGYIAQLEFTVDHETNGWTISLGFDKSMSELQCFQGDATSSDNQNFKITNKEWDGELHAGESFKIEMQATFGSGGKPDLLTADIDGQNLCGGSAPTTSTTSTTTTPAGPTTTTCAPPPTKPEDSTTHPPTPDCTYRKWFNSTQTKATCGGLSRLTGSYPYGEVLCESMLFYEAERSGKLPSDNRVPWRGDSALGDLVVGGYYDAGDFVKFGFPMASMTTMLAWGGVSFPDGYDVSGQAEWFTKTLKWSTDYFIAAHLGDTEFVGQIGDGDVDHASWGRPEDMTMNRPAFKITASAPGSELAAETAAALAASAIWYRCNGDEDYANQCLDHAKTLYAFADEHRGKYTDAIPNAAAFYQSWSGYNDELVWGAAWLAKATNDPSYLAKAEAYYEEFGPWDPQEISWDDKSAGSFLILYELTGDSKYKQGAEKFVDFFLNLEKTAKGLVWSSSSQWGSLRYAANYAHFALQAAKLGIKESEGRSFAESQINYILGDTGRSYVVGWGVDPPTHCHHRAASCPDRPAVCDWNSGMNNPGPNGQVLHGALVGGPDHSDNYVDDRNQFQMTEVATDYNAGFQSCLAAMTANYFNENK